FAMDTFGILFPVIAWIASCFTFIYCMIIVWQTFFGPYRREKLERKSREASPGMLIAPVTLALFVVGIFFFPNVLGDYILKPAMASVFPSFQSDNYLRQPISPWHGFNTELMMTIGILIIGTLLYMSRRYWKGIYNLVPDSWTLDNLYNNTLTQMEAGSSFITSFYMTGYLRHYLLYMYVCFILAVGGVLVYTGAFDFHMANDAPIYSYEWMMPCVVFTSAIAILFAKSRLCSIILNGVIGYAIAVLFVLFRAPDLALTQIVVATVTTALFLLCFYFRPPWRKENAEPRSKRVNLVISIAVGLVFILVALSVKSGKLFDTIAVYFENADELAGGNNIVNTILADFRAFDTMLEVIVLLIAGIGVFSLIRLKAGKGAEKIED